MNIRLSSARIKAAYGRVRTRNALSLFARSASSRLSELTIIYRSRSHPHRRHRGGFRSRVRFSPPFFRRWRCPQLEVASVLETHPHANDSLPRYRRINGSLSSEIFLSRARIRVPAPFQRDLYQNNNNDVPLPLLLLLLLLRVTLL